MKVKNIAFSGFAAAILATTAAHAVEAPQIASKAYVDTNVAGVDTRVTQVNTQVTNLQTNLTENYTATEDLGDVINQNISTAITADDGVIKAELAKKEDTANKAKEITDANKASEVLFPTVGAMTSYTQKAIEDAVTQGVDINTDQITDGAITEAKLKDGSVTTPKIADKAVTTEKLSDELNTKITGAQSAADVSKAITDALGEGGAITEKLDTKANAADVYNKTETDALFDKTVPVPEGQCANESGRCVLSIDATSKKMMWLDVTAPLESTTTGD